MTPERWARITELFDETRQRPAGARERWLQAACDDDAIRTEVLAMVAAYEADPDYLEQAADPVDVVDQADRGVLHGERLGAYRLTRQIGRGGMGVVYEAQRDDREFDRRAAVKILPSWSADVLAERFRFERRLLAALDHPGIARLLDAGTTPGVIPYCVMEFVDGQPIDEWCQARQIDVAGRVALFERVCDAVAYAHGHLVVHRDLKPSNILVTPEGQPKLLDFGIATLLDAENGLSVGTTRTGFTSFTPGFASPEQVRGERVTTASDVYSLGVLLYLLLSGRQPYDLDGLSPLDAMRTVCEHEPPPPSRVAEVSVSTRLRGDLDTIVGKALRKSAGERYATVDALAADLQAWRERRPIAAAPSSWMYVAGRFIRRNTLAVVSAAVVFLAVAGGTVATVRQARIAERERARADARFNDVRRLANAVVGPLYDAIARVPGSTDARRVLVQEALAYLNSLSAQAGPDVGLAVELAAAYEKIGDVQGNPFGPNLGDLAGAQASYLRLHELRTSALHARPGDTGAVLGLAEAERRLGDVAFAENRLDEALAVYARGLERLAALSSADEARTTLAMARLHDRMGNALSRAARSREAAAAFERALALARPLAERPDATPDTRRFLMASLGNSGDVPFYEGRFEEALERYEAARAIARRAAEAPTDLASARRDLQLTTTRSAYALKQLGRLDEGAALEREAIDILADLVARDPQAVSRRFELAQARRGLALTELQRGDPAAAFREISASLETFEVAFSVGPAPDQRFHYATALGSLAEIERARGQLEASAAAYRRAADVFADPVVDSRKPSERFRLQWGLGDVLAELARRGQRALVDDAQAAYRAAREGFAALAARGVLEPGLADAPARLDAALSALDAR